MRGRGRAATDAKQRFQSDALLLLLLQLLLVFEHLLLAHLLLSRLLLASLLLSRLLLAHLLFAHLLFAHLLFAHLLHLAHLLLAHLLFAHLLLAHLLLAHLLFAHLLLAHLLLAHLLLLLHLRRHPGPRVSPSAHQHFLQRHERHARRRVRGSKRQIRREVPRFVPLDQLGALERTLHRPRGVRVQPRRVRHRTHGLGRDTTTGAARSSRWLLLRALLRVLLRVFDAAASVRVIALALERAHEVRAVWRLTTLG